MIEEYIRSVLRRGKRLENKLLRKVKNGDDVLMIIDNQELESFDNIIFEEQWASLLHEPQSVNNNNWGENVPEEDSAERKKKADELGKLISLFNESIPDKKDQNAIKDGLFNLVGKYTQSLAMGSEFGGDIETTRTKLTSQINAIRVITTAISDKMKSIFDAFLKHSKSFVESVLKDFSESNEAFELVSGSDLSETAEAGLHIKICVNPIEKNSSFVTNPNEYLNSFRFVLYCVTLKLAIAFLRMKESRIAVPIVIDDIFDASDFENSLKLEKFVFSVYKAYYKTVLSADFNYPLQLILLTHDELMKSAFERGIGLWMMDEDNRDSNSGQTQGHSYMCGRLIPYYYAKKTEKYFSDDENVCKRAKEAEQQSTDEKSFYNLYYEL